GGEDEAVAGLAHRVPVVDRVRQAAGGPYDRDRPVAQADQLPQSARLETRRHQEHVGAGVDVLGQYRLEADGGRDPGRVVAGVGSEQLLVARVPRTENDEL